MAAVTNGVGTASTTGGTGAQPTGAFTPAANDLLIAFIVASDGVLATPTVSSDSGITFTKITSFTYRTSLDTVYAFVANALATAVSQIVSFTSAGDSTTGSVIFVARVSGMSRTGLGAIKQSSGQSNQAAAGTPAPVFGASALTGNPTLGVIGNSTNPATMTVPTGWTEQSDLGYITPTTGGEYVSRDSGFTGTTITWGGTSASNFASLIVELDASVPAADTPAAYVNGGYYPFALLRKVWQGWTKRRDGLLVPPGLWVPA